MNLEFDVDERLLLEQAGAVFGSISPVELAGHKPAATWAALVEAGWHDLGASVADGTLSLGLAAGVHRLAGRQLLIEQLVTSGYVLSALAARCRADADRAECAERLARRPGVLLGDGRSAAAPIVDEAEREGYCFGVQGEVDVYRLVDRGGLTLSWWDGPPAQIAPTPALSPSVATVRLGEGTWRDFPLDLTAEALATLETETRLLHAAALVGCAEALLTITRDYTLDRWQFGAPIGSYQAVKHALADVFTANEVAWNAVLNAVAEGADTVIAPLVARYLAVEAALGSARAGAQFHGGMGFTAELNVHYFLKAVLDGGQRFGNHEECAEALGREMVKRAC